LVACLEAFGEHWGQKLLNALRALHAVRFGEGFGSEEAENETSDTKSIDRNSFLNFQHDDDDELTKLL